VPQQWLSRIPEVKLRAVLLMDMVVSLCNEISSKKCLFALLYKVVVQIVRPKFNFKMALQFLMLQYKMKSKWVYPSSSCLMHTEGLADGGI
jgi:hypothetical protein